jgi:hypothetical protein
MAERSCQEEIVQRNSTAALNGHAASHLAAVRRYQRMAAGHGKEYRAHQEGILDLGALGVCRSSLEVQEYHWGREIPGAGSCRDLNVEDMWVTHGPLEVAELSPTALEDWMEKAQEDAFDPKET